MLSIQTKQQKILLFTILGKVTSPTCGQPVILAEKCEENTYTLIETSSQPSSSQKLLSVVDTKKQLPKDSKSSVELNLTTKQCGIMCENKNSRELSINVEPLIAERV